MENFTQYNLKSGNILKVIQDDSAESPDAWGNTDVFLVYDHRQFDVKREGFKPEDIFHHLQAKNALEEFLKRTKESLNCSEESYEALLEEVQDNFNYYTDYSKDYFIFPVYAYIHSGVALSLGNSGYPFNCRWDVSSTGFLLVNKTDINFNYSRENSDLYAGKTDEEISYIYGEGLIETWNQYLSGDVYGFNVIERKAFKKVYADGSESEDDDEDFEENVIDSCWGFYGSDPKTNGMIDHIDDEIL